MPSAVPATETPAAGRSSGVSSLRSCARGLLRPGLFVITTSWISAGKIAAALHDSLPVVIFGNNPRQFAFRYDPRALLGHHALVIGPAGSMNGIASGLRAYFTSMLARGLQAALPDPAWRRSGAQPTTGAPPARSTRTTPSPRPLS